MNDWCVRAGTTPRAILPLQTVWALSRLWYHDRLNPAFHGRTRAEAQTIFHQLGLTSPFWQPDARHDTPAGE